MRPCQIIARALGCLALSGSAITGIGLAQDTVPTQTSGLPASWGRTLERLRFYGDFRYRIEGDWNRPGASNRWRARSRLRLGANFSVRDDLLFGTRLSTGPPGDARDSNATSGDDFSKIAVNLDRLFLTWYPIDARTTYVTVGKFAHPFQRNPVSDELVWYSDVQPEGAVFGDTAQDVGPIDLFRAQAGYYLFREKSDGDIRIAVAEFLAGERIGETSRSNVSVAWYGYDNAESHPRATTGNYQILDSIAGILTEIGGKPWAFSAEGISNLASSGRRANGWALGFSCGVAKNAGDWRAFYQYQEIGNDAVFPPIAGADFLIDHNFRGHVANIDYAVSKEVTLRVRGLASTPLEPEFDPGNGETAYRLRFDLNVKF